MAAVGKVSVLYDTRAVVGEGPFYDESRDELVWVDIDGKTLNFLNVNTRTNRTIETEDQVGAAIPCEDDDSKLIAVTGRNICLVDRETGVFSKPLASVESDRLVNRLNDAKCDRRGRLWCGTMAAVPESGPTSSEYPKNNGNFYSFDGDVVTKHVSEISISNGIEWSLDWTKLYYIDSLARHVYSFDYNEQTGAITNQTVAVDYAQDDKLGLPDGMTIDAEGKLWVAAFFGGAVTRWDPETGKKLAYIPIPSKRVTSCCFGGPNYDKLFVTSACVGAKDSELQQYPHPGAVFVVEDLGVRGLPAQKFKPVKK